ncbi:MAG: transposase [Nitrosomonas sp.]|nr:transposase [Nitrosomonas sp.]
MTDLKTHYSCAELAAMKLPGFPATERNMREVANREGWIGQKRTGRGGGFEYLPPAKIQKLIAEHTQIQSQGTEAKALLEIRSLLRIEAEQSRAAKTQVAVSDIMASVTTSGQKKFDARFDIILAWRNYFQEKKYAGSIGRNESFKRFEEDYNDERVQVEVQVRAQYPLVSWRSVQRWVLDSEKEGVLTICDRRHVKGAKVKSQIEAHPELEKAVIAILTEKNHIQSSHLVDILNHARIDKDTGEILWPQISYSAVCRYRRKFEENNAQALLAETNPDAWKNKYLSSLGKLDGDVVRLNQRWEMDGTPADWEFIDGRYTASVVLDIFGRRPMIRFSKTPRTETNKQLTRAAIMKWGVPEQIKTDNGTDYVSREMRLCFEMLNIEHLLSAPFSPWEKGHVERFIKTYLHSVLEMLDNFIGHNVAERKQIEAKRTFAENLFKKNAVVKVDMTAEEMQRLTDAWIDGVYMVKQHSSLGVSPLEKVASWVGATRQINSERALDILLAKPAKTMPVITKKGIRYDKADFIHPLLPLPEYCGKQAEISLDPNDLGRIIVYVGGKFVCIAECAERTGIDRQEIAAHGRALQKEAVAQKRKEFRAAKKALPMSTANLVKDMLIKRAAKAGKVEILQSRIEKHETARLIEAERAIKAMEVPQVSPEHARILEEARQMAAKARNPNPTILSHPAQAQSTPLEGMSNEQKYKLWLDFAVTVKSGEKLTESWQQRFYDGYPKTSAYRAQAALHQEESLLARQR